MRWLFSRSWGDTALALLAPLWVVALGQTGWPGQGALARIGDLSYGLYLWSFPVQQTLVQTQPGIGVTALLGETLLIALPLAWLSWRLVERPALALKPWAHRQLARFNPEVRRVPALTSARPTCGSPRPSDRP